MDDIQDYDHDHLLDEFFGNFTEKKVSSRKISVLIVLGIMDSKSYLRSVSNYMKTFKERNDIDIHVEYEQSKMQVVTDIIKSQFVKNVGKHSKFTLRIFNKTIELLKGGGDVMLVGYSYGGHIVSCVSEKLNTYPKKDIERLQVATFGSTHISKMHFVSNICIRQFMYTNDYLQYFQGCE